MKTPKGAESQKLCGTQRITHPVVSLSSTRFIPAMPDVILLGSRGSEDEGGEAREKCCLVPSLKSASMGQHSVVTETTEA